ncbi:MAG: BMP family ABC transporter substrate-binding protein [Oscillospiraceae bacterium]
MKSFIHRVTASILAVCLSVTLFAACKQQPTVTEKTTLNALLIVSELGDKSFNDSAAEGMKKAEKDFGITLTMQETKKDKVKVCDALETASKDGKYNIICVSSTEDGAAGKWLLDNSAKYPKIKYIHYDASHELKYSNDNVQYITFNQSQADFLAGALAALVSKTKVVAFIGGSKDETIDDFLVGFLSGVKYVNNGTKVYVDYVGDWSSTDKAYEIAQKASGMNADVIHAVAGGAGDGALSYCAENGIKFIGVDSDQYGVYLETAPEKANVIITSVLKECGVALYNAIGYISKGVFVPGISEYDLSNGGTCLVKNDFYRTQVSNDIRSLIGNYQQKIIDGSIKVPTAYNMEAVVLEELLENYSLNK